MEQERQYIQNQFKNDKNNLINQINFNNENIKLDDKQIKLLKEKKNITRDMLKQHYLQELKKNKGLQNTSMVWITKALLNINEDVNQSEIFPSIIDQQSVSYLIEYAQSEINYDELTFMLQKQQLQNISSSKLEENNFDKNYLNTQYQYNINTIKNKVSKLAQQTVKIKNPLLIQSSKTSIPNLVWEDTESAQKSSN
ncbi:hypothetical protein IMG5_186950, partial [Ichthyophthirius multifiliis]